MQWVMVDYLFQTTHMVHDMRNIYCESHGDIGTPCFWSKSMIFRLKALAKQLFSELHDKCPENHRMISDAQALITFLDAVSRGTEHDMDFDD